MPSFSGTRAVTALFLAAALLVTGFAGCGGSNGDVTDRSDSASPIDQSIVVAAAVMPQTLDPLTTNTADGHQIARQIFEPLGGNVRSAQSRKRIMGLVKSWQRSLSGRVWLARLRDGLSFQDGTKLDARAVVANSRRWRTAPEVADLIGNRLQKVTAPRSTLVRFSLREPLIDLPSKLASPRLGLVSPKALTPASSDGARVKRVRDAGSGPFKLDSADERTVVLLANEDWWAKSHGISPALGKIRFSLEPEQNRRINRLKSNSAQLATGIDQATLDTLADDPNVQVLGVQDGSGYASVLWLRGINLSKLGATSLAAAWISGVQG